MDAKCTWCKGLGYWRDDCDQRRVNCSDCESTGSRSVQLKNQERARLASIQYHKDELKKLENL